MWFHQDLLYGLYRLSALRQTRMHLQIFGSGSVLLGELSILGAFLVVPHLYFLRRKNRAPESTEEKVTRYCGMLFTEKRFPIMPHSRIPIAYFTSVLRGKMKGRLRVKLILSAFLSIIHYAGSIGWDIAYLLRRGWRRLTGNYCNKRGQGPSC